MTQDHDPTSTGSPPANIPPDENALPVPVRSGDRFESSWRTVSQSDAHQFRDAWDPLPKPIDDTVAESPLSAQHLLCLRQVLMHEAPWHGAVLRPLRLSNVSFREQAHPGARVRLLARCDEVRAAGNEVHAVFESTLEHATIGPILTLTEVVALRPPADADGHTGAARPLIDGDTAYRLASSLAMMRERGVDEDARLAHIAAQCAPDDNASRELLEQFEAGYSAGRRSALGVPATVGAAEPDAPLYAIARQMGVQSVETMMAEDRAHKARRQQRSRVTAAVICATAVIFVLVLLIF